MNGAAILDTITAGQLGAAMATVSSAYGSPIDLGLTAPFDLGDVRVCPSTRQLMRRGQSMTLEPRVMLVLVALGEEPLRVVPRDELIMRCWNGRVVGDNAIHRAISRLREIGADFARSEFSIETINKVGYRLSVRAGAGTPAELQLPAARFRPAMPLAVVGTIVAAAAIIASPMLGPTIRGAGQADTLVATEAVQSLAPLLTTELSTELNRAGVPVSILVRPAKKRALIMDARVPAAVSPPVAVLTLSDPSGEQLWSKEIRIPARDDSATASAAFGHALSCATRLVGPLTALDAAVVRIAMAACDQLAERPSETLVATLASLAQARPQSAPVWAKLALVEAQLSTITAGDRQTAPVSAFRRASEQHARRAARLVPDEPMIFAVRSLLAADDWSAKLSLERQGMALAQRDASLHVIHSRTALSLGFMSAAVHSARKAAAIDKYSPMVRANLVSVLAAAGLTRQAAEELALAQRVWPGQSAMVDAAARFAFRYGNARQLVGDEQAGDLLSSGAVPLRDGQFDRFIAARVQPTPRSVDLAVHAAAETWRRSKRAPHLYLQSLGEFSRVDEAYRVLSDPAAVKALRQSPDILFRPGMRSIRHDPRFIQIAGQLGLLSIWSSTDQWPDFCLEAELPYNCRIEAAKLRPAASPVADP